MYAIIEDSGSQMKVAEGDVLTVDLREGAEAGSEIIFDRVLMIGNDGDADATMGLPYVDGASVKAKVRDEIKGDKLYVTKFRRRKGYRRKTGHRQRYLEVEILGINRG